MLFLYLSSFKVSGIDLTDVLHYLPENKHTNEQQRQTKQIEKKKSCQAFMYTFKTAKMPSSGQMGLLQDLNRRGEKDHCRDCKQFLADLIIARKTQHWPVKDMLTANKQTRHQVRYSCILNAIKCNTPWHFQEQETSGMELDDMLPVNCCRHHFSHSEPLGNDAVS